MGVIMKGYRLKDKRERNKKIMEYRAKGYTLRAIAGVFHITQSAVWKIVKRLENENRQ